MRGWNIATGGCDHVIRGHDAGVRCIVTWEQYLVTGSDDHTINIGGDWVMALPGLDCCAHLLGQCHGGVEGPSDQRLHRRQDMCKFDCESGAGGHSGWTHLHCFRVGCALRQAAEHRLRQQWLLGTWEQVRVVRVSEHVPKVLTCRCLAISGSKLLCGEDLDQDDDASDKGDRDNAKKGFTTMR